MNIVSLENVSKNYAIIDDVLSLPERMPNIYRRLTSERV